MSDPRPSAFFRLHPQLRHAIVHDLGWRSLRPVQELAIEATLDGANSVVLAPTAGGKTEAALFPVLSRILAEGLPPVSALYVCPIRALLNNQEERLAAYARMVGLEVFKWHGDVSDSAKARFRARPANILMTTPESIEVMMISSKTDAKALFANLEVVVIDEVHAFAGDDRGAHLASLIERLAIFAERDIQRIGLSATVGNPLLIGEWLRGSSKRPFKLVDPPKAAMARELVLDYRVDTGEVARAIAPMARGKKSLVFVESRARAEEVAHSLAGSGVEVFIHHSAVSRQDRTLAEEKFARGENTAIVCTSTMELGIDVGDLDQVVQVEAPGSVASFLQRIGRTGRRAGSVQRATVVCTTPESLLQAAAILELAGRGWVEDVRPPIRAMHVLAHQILALMLQEHGISRHRLSQWVQAAYPFAGIREERMQALIDTMVAREILFESEGILSLGQRGERLYGRKHFFELYAVFSSPPIMRVMWRQAEIGQVQAGFVALEASSPGFAIRAKATQDGPERENAKLSFRLGGRAWQVEHVEWSRGVLHVEPAEAGRLPRWLGQPSMLSEPICQAMMGLLCDGFGDSVAASMSATAKSVLDGMRESYAGLLAAGTAPLEENHDLVQWHTFAGGAINRLLAAGLERRTQVRWSAGNLSLRAPGVSAVTAMEAIRTLLAEDWEGLAAEIAGGVARGPVSKFQPCLPAVDEERLLSERLLDVPGVLRFLGRITVNGRKVAAGVARIADHIIAEELALPGMPSALSRLSPVLSIVWIDDDESLRNAVERVRTESFIGLDTETDVASGALCLLQVSTALETYVIDALAVDLGQMREALEGEMPIKVVHHAAFDRRVLATRGISLGGVFDTLEASRARRGAEILGGHSLASVCERELGMTLDKSHQTSNWSRRPLAADAVAYAALDAEVLRTLYERLRPSSVPGL